MRIKKLELVGFKSFKDRTVIQFDEGITGIVGPNGCGKSNIVDALIWVMGEMSAKHLRGSSMEDVIFAGAEGYAPMGMAEVSLTLENDGGPFPVQYLKHSEIMITRRLHRSGDSEYLINREVCRLRDVQEIFMDTGAGSKGFSIIEQGAIGKIITARPEERRVLIEEAAGITKFKARKRESQRKLVATDQNLVRLNDIVGELKRQMESLQRQAQKAAKYREVKNEIEQIDLVCSTKNYLHYQEESSKAREILLEKQERQAEAQSQMQTLESELAQERLKQTEKEKEVETLQKEHFEKQSELQKLEASLQELRFEIEQARRNKEMTGSLAEEQRLRKDLLTKDDERLSTKVHELRNEVSLLQSQYEERAGAFEENQALIENLDQELTDKRRELLAVSQTHSHLDAKVHAEEVRVQESRENLERIQLVLDELLLKRDEFTTRRNSLFSEVEGQRQMQLSIMQDIENFEANRQILEAKVAERRAEVETFKDRVNQISSRLYGLENMQSNFEGFQEGVRNVMLWQKQGDKSEYQLLSEMIEVPSQYEVAMEATLGTKLQVLVAQDSTQSLSAIEYLKNKKGGRSSFYSLSEGGGGSVVERTDQGPAPEMATGAVQAILSDVVSVVEEYRSALSPMLERVAIVDSISSALDLRPKFPKWTFVTPEGDLLSPDGVLTGGSSESADSGVLKRKREIKELSLQKEEWEGKLALAQVTQKKQEDQLKGVLGDLENAKKTATEQEIRVTTLQKDYERSEQELQSAQRALDRETREKESVDSQLQQRILKFDELQKHFQEMGEKKTTLETSVETIDEKLQSSQIGFDDLQNEVTELKVRLASKKQEADGLENQLKMVQENLRDVTDKLSRISVENEKSSESISTNQVLMEEKRLTLDHLITEVSDLARRLSQGKDDFEIIHRVCREHEEQLSQLVSSKSEILTTISEAQLKLEQVKMKQEYLVNQIEERYQRQLPELVEQYRNVEVDPDSEEKLKELRQKLGRMGDVNLSAIEEFEEISGRYEFMHQQQSDLIKAKEQLGKVIDKINRICSKRFKETFELVNERFQKVFPVLFGGGEAKLVLVEDQEKGEMGIDIIAKPPGKKMQNVTLMSGGEKALTAVALIFSIFLVKPSPYCLLDEVDAPLDDANVQRFNDLVREMAKRSQIIVVTHNKYTMEINKKLYGVTMEEKGVSKMVSVSLEDAHKVVG